MIGGAAQTTDGVPLLAGGGAHPACGCGPPPDRRLILDEDEEEEEEDEDTDVSELESDDTDIDAVVAEFRQHSVQVRARRGNTCKEGCIGTQRDALPINSFRGTTDQDFHTA